MTECEVALDKIRQVWNRPPDRSLSFWMEHPLIRSDRLNLLVSGHRDRDCHQWFIEIVRNLGFTLPVESCLSLGCGFGELERGYTQYHFATRHEGVDVAEGAIESARKAAAEGGHSHIHYRVADLNTEALPRSVYDVVIAHQSIHHIECLEHLARQVELSLKPGGLLMINEYVGLNRLQISEKQRAFGSALLTALPSRYVSMADGRVRRSMEVPSPEEVQASDPSEAVRSDEIIRVFSQTFEVLERRDYGGNFLHLGLNGLIANFCTDDHRDERWLRWLFDAEDRLLDEGVPSDFAVLILRRPS